MLKILTILLFLCPLTAIAFCGQPQLPKECDEHGNCRTTLPPSTNQKLNLKALAEQKAAKSNCLMTVAPPNKARFMKQHQEQVANEIVAILRNAAATSSEFIGLPSEAKVGIKLKILASGKLENVDIAEYHGYPEFEKWIYANLATVKQLKPQPNLNSSYSVLTLKISAKDLMTNTG